MCTIITSTTTTSAAAAATQKIIIWINKSRKTYLFGQCGQHFFFLFAYEIKWMSYIEPIQQLEWIIWCEFHGCTMYIFVYANKPLLNDVVLVAVVGRRQHSQQPLEWRKQQKIHTKKTFVMMKKRGARSSNNNWRKILNRTEIQLNITSNMTIAITLLSCSAFFLFLSLPLLCVLTLSFEPRILHGSFFFLLSFFHLSSIISFHLNSKYDLRRNSDSVECISLSEHGKSSVSDLMSTYTHTHQFSFQYPLKCTCGMEKMKSKKAVPRNDDWLFYLRPRKFYLCKLFLRSCGNICCAPFYAKKKYENAAYFFFFKFIA